jgi:hypothetical protein
MACRSPPCWGMHIHRGGRSVAVHVRINPDETQGPLVTQSAVRTGPGTDRTRVVPPDHCEAFAVSHGCRHMLREATAEVPDRVQRFWVCSCWGGTQNLAPGFAALFPGEGMCQSEAPQCVGSRHTSLISRP